MTTRSEIESLIYLLDDPDPFVKENVEQKLIELGEQAVPMLDQQKSESMDDSERQRINDIIHNITFDSLIADFEELLDLGISNMEQLEKLVFTLARFHNPTLRTLEYTRKLDKFAGMIEDEILYSVTDREKLDAVLRFIFDELGFKGDAENYHDIQNAFIDRVIDRRKGLPISLALVVLFIARRLNLPFYGVNMPIHFMLGFDDGKETLLIDPFDKGKIVTYNQCYYFLKRNNVQPKAEFFNPAPPAHILARCIRNMIHAYTKQNEERRVEELKRLLLTVEAVRA